jgi:hypothetical protein
MTVLWLAPSPLPVGIHCLAIVQFGFPTPFPCPDEMGIGIWAAARSRIGEPALKHGLAFVLAWWAWAE